LGLLSKISEIETPNYLIPIKEEKKVIPFKVEEPE
jgi:hypothetical protein